MKRFFHRLTNNEHAQKCVWMLMCSMMASAVGGVVGAIAGPRGSLWGVCIAGGYALLMMSANYVRLWDISFSSQPKLRPAADNTAPTTAPQPVAAR